MWRTTTDDDEHYAYAIALLTVDRRTAFFEKLVKLLPPQPAKNFLTFSAPL